MRRIQRAERLIDGYYVRLTEAQKSLIQAAFPPAIGTATFTRELLVEAAKQALSVQAGDLSPTEAAQAFIGFFESFAPMVTEAKLEVPSAEKKSE